MAVVQIPNLPPAIAISGAELIEIVQNGVSLRTLQQTGAPLGSLNPLPGTAPNAPGDTGPGLPYNNTSVPETGPIE